MAKVKPTVIQRAKRLLRDDGGVLTRELMRSPGGFGLGQVPTRLKPDATTTMVCGFCSTGCGLDVHMRAGEAISLTPSVQYPVNLGMACPKGWEALAPLRAPDRARSPMLRRARSSGMQSAGGDAGKTKVLAGTVPRARAGGVVGRRLVRPVARMSR